jgi:hypothetical protein
MVRLHGRIGCAAVVSILTPDDPRVIAQMEADDLWMAFFLDSEGNMHAVMREVGRR